MIKQPFQLPEMSIMIAEWGECAFATHALDGECFRRIDIHVIRELGNISQPLPVRDSPRLRSLGRSLASAMNVYPIASGACCISIYI